MHTPENSPQSHQPIDLESMLGEVVFIVEADKFELTTLWLENEWAKELHALGVQAGVGSSLLDDLIGREPFDWVQDAVGFDLFLGHDLQHRPMSMTAQFESLNGHKVLFVSLGAHRYEAVARKTAGEWLKQKCHLVLQTGELAITQAGDFAKCIKYLHSLGAK